jgi:hypothetical protein
LKNLRRNQGGLESLPQKLDTVAQGYNPPLPTQQSTFEENGLAKGKCVKPLLTQQVCCNEVQNKKALRITSI